MTINLTGLCECGCGQPTPIARQNHTKHGYIKGQPMRFVTGHHKRAKRTLQEAFLEHFVAGAPDECWEWAGQRANTGYGRVSYSGLRLLAHRVSYTIHVGPVPDDKEVCHRCDNKPCVNPHHLFLGSHADNMRDAQQKGLMATKLNWETVHAIRALAATGLPQSEIAKRFGVNATTISGIVRNRTWTIPT